MDDPDIVDLPPQEWRSEDKRTKPKEPFFGTGFWPAVAWLIGAAIMFTAIHFVVVR